MNKYNRKAYQEKAFAVYQGAYENYITTILNSRHGGGAGDALENIGHVKGQENTPTKADELNDYNKPVRNVLKRVASLLSVLYTQSPRRRSGQSKEVDEFLRSGISGLDVTLDEVNKRTWGVGDWFILPFWGDDKKVYLELIEPWLVDVETDRGVYKSATIPHDDDTFTRYYWDGKAERLNSKKEVESTFDTGLGCNPVVWFRLSPVAEPCDPWSVRSIWDLVEGTIDLGVLECYHKHNAYLRSFKVVGIEAADGQPVGDVSKIKIGNKQLVPFTLSSGELADPNDPFGGTVSKMEHDLAGTRGVSVVIYKNEYKSEGTYTYVFEEMRQHWKKAVKVFQGPERHLLRVCLAIAKKESSLKCDPEKFIYIDYVEPAINLESVKLSQDALEQGIALGIKSPVTYLLTTNTDIPDRKTAEKILQQNAEDRHMVNELQRDANAPSEPGNPGKTPEENGAMGGAMGGKSDDEKEEIRREETGANGPPVNSKPYRK